MDVNEKIVETWLRQVKSMFTMTEIYYGNYHKDIDILAIDMCQKEAWDCEVKVRTGTTQITHNQNKQNGFWHFKEGLQNKTRNDVIHASIGDLGFQVKKKFITTKSLLGKTQRNQIKWIKEFNSNNIDIIFFDQIINELSTKAKALNKSTNEVVQVLRLFHIYENIEDDSAA